MTQDSERINSLANTWLTFSQKTATDTPNAVDNAHRMRLCNDEYARLSVIGTVASVANNVPASTGSTGVSIAQSPDTRLLCSTFSWTV